MSTAIFITIRIFYRFTISALTAFCHLDFLLSCYHLYRTPDAVTNRICCHCPQHKEYYYCCLSHCLSLLYGLSTALICCIIFRVFLQKLSYRFGYFRAIEFFLGQLLIYLWSVYIRRCRLKYRFRKGQYNSSPLFLAYVSRLRLMTVYSLVHLFLPIAYRLPFVILCGCLVLLPDYPTTFLLSFCKLTLMAFVTSYTG